jgi:hypothetical protein
MHPILNIADAESRPVTNGDIFEARLAPLAERLGGRDIGANVTTVPPARPRFHCIIITEMRSISSSSPAPGYYGWAQLPMP